MRLRATAAFNRAPPTRGVPILMVQAVGDAPVDNGDGTFTWTGQNTDFNMRFMPGLPSPSGLYEVYFKIVANTFTYGLALDVNDTDTLNTAPGQLGDTSLVTSLVYQWFDFYSGPTTGQLRITMPVMRKILVT